MKVWLSEDDQNTSVAPFAGSSPSPPMKLAKCPVASGNWFQLKAMAPDGAFF